MVTEGAGELLLHWASHLLLGGSFSLAFAAPHRTPLKTQLARFSKTCFDGNWSLAGALMKSPPGGSVAQPSAELNSLN